jgi:dTDP-4-dehydrorhamnose reductase
MKILILGVNGMLGSTLFKYFLSTNMEVFGTLRGDYVPDCFLNVSPVKIITAFDAKDFTLVEKVHNLISPDVVINCIGLVKQLPQGNDPLEAIPLNGLLPHFLAKLCAKNSARLIHFSTDCVFSGMQGGYKESDVPDATDIYGRSKLLGEVVYESGLTLRSSIIGHELIGAKSLVSWFLSQTGTIKGYQQAIYSGIPTIEMATIVEQIIMKHPRLTGLYHVASNPISKCQLLQLIKEVYQKQINIIPSDDVIIDRSLDASLFNRVTGYRAPDWKRLIEKMHAFEQECSYVF